MSLLHDIALTCSPYWSHRIAKEVIEHFPDRAQIFETSLEELYDRLPKYKRWGEDFVLWRKQTHIAACEKKLAQYHLQAISIDDHRYPALLKEIHDPPLVLFVEGNLPQKNSWCAIVGSRQATAYGKQQAFRLSSELARHNIGIVTGLAFGIDEEAIKGALQTHGSIVTVLAGGHAYQTHREKELKKYILTAGGAMISEHIPTTEPQQYFFPIRNRIIAGIAKQTIVVEAKIKSGSLITAQKALEENREVFAVPGQITSPTSAGCHKLIQEGATLCRGIHDILNIPEEEMRTIQDKSKQIRRNIPALSEFEQKIWDFLKEPRTFDFLVEYAKEKEPEVAGILNIWEIEGYLTVKNGHYHLVSYEHSPHC